MHCVRLQDPASAVSEGVNHPSGCVQYTLCKNKVPPKLSSIQTTKHTVNSLDSRAQRPWHGNVFAESSPMCGKKDRSLLSMCRESEWSFDEGSLFPHSCHVPRINNLSKNSL